MKPYTVTRPQLREVLSIIGIYPLETVPHPTHSEWNAWIYDRDDIRTDTAINTFYALKQLEDKRSKNGEK